MQTIVFQSEPLKFNTIQVFHDILSEYRSFITQGFQYFSQSGSAIRIFRKRFDRPFYQNRNLFQSEEMGPYRELAEESSWNFARSFLLQSVEELKSEYGAKRPVWYPYLEHVSLLIFCFDSRPEAEEKEIRELQRMEDFYGYEGISKILYATTKDRENWRKEVHTLIHQRSNFLFEEAFEEINSIPVTEDTCQFFIEEKTVQFLSRNGLESFQLQIDSIDEEKIKNRVKASISLTGARFSIRVDYDDPSIQPQTKSISVLGVDAGMTEIAYTSEGKVYGRPFDQKEAFERLVEPVQKIYEKIGMKIEQYEQLLAIEDEKENRELIEEIKNEYERELKEGILLKEKLVELDKERDAHYLAIANCIKEDAKGYHAVAIERFADTDHEVSAFLRILRKVF
ncbi:hypothetical protein [Aneurinibacillus tyrosinisolvens]|uniref:hypothetical protein n=1 Tax=Aneurinibacillus tyrosinisolvens TaxID=1443435 RepID=UPI00063EDD8E|nr:hypothetical protein [Aneurinibacillus tyrosinisolvens]